jgi:hypothetical protein
MENKVVLHWQLPNPESVRTFVIQRADANNEWTTLASVESNYSLQDYSADDRNPLPGYNSYRILMIGNNNSVSYSSIRRVFVNMQQGMITVFPNPATDKITVRSNLSGQADMKLVDLSGKIVWQKQGALNPTQFIYLPGLPAGVYALHINETVTKLSIR